MTAAVLGRFAYADPPYIGRARRYYGREGDPFEGDVGEVDHAQLVDRLEAGGYAGWALSCATDTIDEITAILRARGLVSWRDWRLGLWVKPGVAPRGTMGVHAMSELVIVRGGRRVAPGVRDWLMAHPARGGGDLPGRKPIAFCAWLFDLLGMVPGDELDDLFPGTGVVSRAWRVLSTQPAAKRVDEAARVALTSLVPGEDGVSVQVDDGASRPGGDEASTPANDARSLSSPPGGDASSAGVDAWGVE